MTVNLAAAPGFVASTWREQIVEYTGPASYVTGGDPVVPAEVRMGRIFGVYGVISNGTAVYLVWYDVANQALMIFVPNTGVQVANGVDLSTFVGNLLFIGQ